jgi:hypothetical protein
VSDTYLPCPVCGVDLRPGDLCWRCPPPVDDQPPAAPQATAAPGGKVDLRVVGYDEIRGLYDIRRVAGTVEEFVALPRRGPNRPAASREEIYRRVMSSLGRRGVGIGSSTLAESYVRLTGDALDLPAVEVHGPRVAGAADRVWVDSGADDGTSWEITPGRVHTQQRLPVAVTRARGTPLAAAPAGEGSHEPLMRRLNVPARDLALIRAWLVVALIPQWQCPILSFAGPQGSGKTTAAGNIAGVVDPGGRPVSLSDEPEDVAMTLRSRRVLVADNLSTVGGRVSDLLCMAVTGGAMIRRTLYTTADITEVEIRRPIIATSIGLAGRPDLADRTITVSLEKLGAELGPEQVTLGEQDRAVVFRAVLDDAAAALERARGVQLAAPVPRMVDYARVLVVLGGGGYERYQAARQDAAQDVIESSPWACALRDLVDANQGSWSGTASELLKKLAKPTEVRRWPASARVASTETTRVAPDLARLGYHIEQHRVGGFDRTRVITITHGEPVA